MLGRVLYASLFVLALASGSALAAAADAQNGNGVTYQNGVLSWQRLEHRPLQPKTITRFDSNLEPGASKVISAGHPGTVEVLVQYSQRDGGPVHQKILTRTVIEPCHPRVVAEGISETTLAAFEARGLAKMASVARGAIEMIATAYTADSAGGSGRTAIGRRAGYGIVAVDPRVIPLGSRLYIPGYGMAIAGDTGGDIVGRRIDLGFDSYRSALRFGRRDVTVYRL